MIGTSVRSLVMLSLIIGMARSQEPAAPQGTVKLGAAKGVTIAYETRAESTEVQGLDSPDSREAHNELVRNFELKVLDTTPDGGAVVEYRCNAVRATFKAALGATMELDSSKPVKETEPTKRVLRTIVMAEVGQPLVLTLDARARITAIRGVEALRSVVGSDLAGFSEELRRFVEPWFADDHRREMLQAILVQLPQSAPDAGTAWEPGSPHHFCPGIGGECQRLPLTSRVESATPSEVRIATSSQAAESRKLEDYGRITEVKTRARVSRADGLPIGITTDLESVAQVPLAEGPRRVRLRIHSVTTRLSDKASSPADSRPGADRKR